jgi:hypothetical protein
MQADHRGDLGLLKMAADCIADRILQLRDRLSLGKDGRGEGARAS